MPARGDAPARERERRDGLPAYSSLRRRLAVRESRGGGGWTTRSGWARARRGAPDTLAEAGRARPRRRMSAGRKREAVLRLLRGENLELVCVARGDGRRAERLARRVPRRRRGLRCAASPSRASSASEARQSRFAALRRTARIGGHVFLAEIPGRARRPAGRRLTAPRLAGPRSRRGGPSWRRRQGRERGGCVDIRDRRHTPPLARAGRAVPLTGRGSRRYAADPRRRCRWSSPCPLAGVVPLSSLVVAGTSSVCSSGTA